MASEKSFSISLSVSKGGAAINTGTLSKSIDMTGNDMTATTQAVGTAAEVLDMPADVGTPFDLVVKNNDATNYVELFREVGCTNLLSKLKPGQSCCLTALDVVPYARANTAACQIQFWAAED